MSELDKIDWGSIEISTYDPTEVTAAEKMEFGARAETTFTGNLGRYLEASYDYMTKPDLTYGEALGNIESTRMREVYQEMPEFFGIQPEQEDAAIIGGRVATAFVDPITWAVPWTKVAAAGKLASAATGASFAVADSAARDYMTTGEISGFNTGVSAVIGGGAGTLSGYLARNVRFADDIEPKKLESTLEAPEAITADELGNVKKAAAKAVDPQKVKKATEETPVMTSSTQPINEARKALALLQKEKDALPKKDQGPVDAKIEDMKVKLQATRDEYFINQRDTYLDKQDVNMTMLEGLSAEGKLTEGIMAKILYETTRPVVGGLGGFALSGIVGDEDDYGLTVGMTLAGAGLGTWQSLLRRSKLTSIEKETGLLMVNKYASNNAATSAKRLFAGTLSTKLDAMGGYAKMVGNMLFQRQGASTDAVEARAIRETRKFNTTVNTILGDSFGDMNVRQLAGQIINGFNVDDIRVGYRGINGTLKPVTAEQIEMARQAAPKLLNHQEMLSNSLREVGIDFKKLDEYGMAQTYNMAAIRSDVAGFDETLREAVRLQNPKAKEEQINKIFTDLRNNITGKRSYNKNTTYTAENVFNENNQFKPLLDHFDKKRMITDFEARKLLAEKGFINLDVSEVFSTYSDRAIKGREFAATFGPKGEFLGEVFKKLDASFSGSDRVDFGNDYKKEILNGIDAYWGTYGVGDYNQIGRTFMSTLTTAANTTYLTRVSIASFGDMIQPFQNSGFGAAARSILRKINPNEVSFSTQSNFKYDNAFEKELTALLAASGDSLSSYQAGLNYINKKFFSWVQLERITKAARGFAYDTGINRAFTLASKKNLSKSNKAEAKTMGLTSQDIDVLKQYKNAQQAFNSEEGLEILDRIGQKVADRDAIVPMVGNRLLFTQTKNPYVRSFGQFLSWSQAKTSQINSLVERVENGDTALALRTLGLTSIYGAVQGLREVASPSYDPKEDAVNVYDTEDLTQLTKRSLALSGNYTPWQIDKLTQTGMSLVTQGKLLDEASPSISYALDFFKELGKAGSNIAAGDTEGAVVNVAAITPFGKEVLSYGERLNLFEELEDRTNREKGGVITDVPNAPEEPDQRIDKMTGLPYDQQAGTAFVDQEDSLRRLGFGDGGYIDPMQRLGFGIGSLVARQANKFLDKADDVIPPSSNMGMPTTSNMKGTTEEFDDLTQAIDKGETPKMFEVKAEPVTMLTPSKPLSIGIDESLADGSKLKNYSMKDIEELDSLLPTASAGTKAADQLIGAEVAEGTKSGVRLNLNSKIEGSSDPSLSKLQTIHQNNYDGKALSYAPYVTLEDVTFSVNQKRRVGIASKIKGLDVPEARNKTPAMSVDGSYTKLRNILKEMDDDVVEIGVNPANQHLFVDLKTGQAVKGADIATVIGDRVYAKGVTYFKKSEAPDPLAASDGTDIGSTVRYRRNVGGKVLNVLKRKQYQKGSEVRSDMRRSDGSTKSARGYLGPIKNNVSGGTMTEFATKWEDAGIEIPTMVPTLSKEEIKYMQNMKPGQGWNVRENPMDEQIINKAKQHARMRIDQGKNPFYQDGE